MTPWACPQGQMRAGARGWAGVPMGEVGQCGGVQGHPRARQEAGSSPQDPALAQARHGHGWRGSGRPSTQRRVCGHGPGRLCSPPTPHPRLLFLCQINNYLTVPAHKLDSPTMSRARIGSGKAGRGGSWRRPRGWARGHCLLKMRLQQGPGLRGSAERTCFSGPAFLPSRELLLYQVELGVHQRGSPQKSGPAVLPRDRVLHGGGSC